MSAAVASAPQSDDAPLTSRTHDGTTGHTTTQPVQPRPASPAQSAYTPFTGAASTAAGSASAEESKEPAPAAAAIATAKDASLLAKTQTLVPAPPSSASPGSQSSRSATALAPLRVRPSSQASAASSSSARGSVSRSASGSRTGRLAALAGGQQQPDASKLPYYRQTLVEPAPEAVHTLSAAHLASLPAAALRAHISRANADALALMRQKQYQAALERLRRAEAFAAHPTLRRANCSPGGRRGLVQLRAATYNNLAILYKSVNDLRLALHYCNRALRLEINFVPPPPATASAGAEASASASAVRAPNPAGTHLNMAAILSTMGRHSSALLHAECALSSLYMELHHLAQQALAAKKEKRRRARAAKHQQQQQQQQYGGGGGGAELDHGDEDDSDAGVGGGARGDSHSASLSSSDKTSLLHMIAISYHNMAVEQEFLRQFRAATHSYRRAADFAQKRLGADHALTRMIVHAYEGATNLHPLRVAGASQSMNPHVALTVSNVRGAHMAGVGPSAHNKWLVPALENTAMTARHIPVRVVPWNSFAEVSGMPGRAASAAPSPAPLPPTGAGAGTGMRGRRPGPRHHSMAEEEKDAGYYGHAGGDDNDGEGEGDESGAGAGAAYAAGEALDEEDDGPELSEHDLRARNAAQKRALQAVGGWGPHPAHPPPQHMLNPEDDSAAGGGAATAGQGQAQGMGAVGADGGDADEVGYWSDPEMLALPGVGGPASLRKHKQDPRTAATAKAGQPRQASVHTITRTCTHAHTPSCARHWRSDCIQ